MTEYFTVKQIDNSRLQRSVTGARVRDLWRRLAVGLALAGCLFFYAWQHFECIQIRYEIEQLDAQRAQAAELNQQLHLEVATLRAPGRVDAIAHQQLGLTVPVPGQIVPLDQPADGVVAQMRATDAAPRP